MRWRLVAMAAPLVVDWQRVPFAEGPWITWGEGGNDPALAAPLNASDGPFHFAGSHISAFGGHWQEGAILSARRAVAMALQGAAA